jgi:uncharacterized SAM-binding protein YcdF (DUF218 family)
LPNPDGSRPSVGHAVLSVARNWRASTPPIGHVVLSDRSIDEPLFSAGGFCNKFSLELGYCEKGLKTANRYLLHLTRLHAWLSPADAPRNADLIFVLAGRVYRKDYALELFRQGLAPRILFSVGRFEIRRFSKMALPVPLDLLKLAQEVPASQRHYFVFFEGEEVRTQHVLPGRFGTLTEIDAFGQWVNERPNIRSVLIVSSGTHLRRIRMCCRSLLDPNIRLAFLAAPLFLSEQPVPEPDEQQQDYAQPEESSGSAATKEDLIEMFKLAIYWVLLKIR